MRHGKKFNTLGRTASHRKHMLSNMAASLITHKRINTTVPKAKALRKYVEPLITRSKTDNTHSRRVVFRYLQDKDAVNELFRDVAPKVAERPGGYVRIIRLGSRKGDNAEMCMIELVDYNELMLADKEDKDKKKSGSGKRRRRRGGRKKSSGGGQGQQQEAASGEASSTETQESAQEAASHEQSSQGKVEGETSSEEEASQSEGTEESGDSQESDKENKDQGNENDEGKGSGSN